MSLEKKLWYLENFNLFSELPAEGLRTLAAMSEMRLLHKKEIIGFPPKYHRSIYFLKRGHVKLYRLTDSGREAIIDILGPGELFGDLPGDESYEDDGVEIAEALEEGLICTVGQREFIEFASRHPGLNRRLLKWMVLRFRRIEARVEDLICKDAFNRICSFLKRYADDFAVQKNGIVVIPNFLSQREIAHATATSRQTVASTLGALRRDGILDFDRSTLKIFNLAKLCA